MNKHLHLILATLLIISSCEQTSRKESIQNLEEVDLESAYAETSLQPNDEGNSPQKTSLSPATNHKLIKTVNMRLKVASVEKDLEYINDQATKLGGYVADYDQKMNKNTVKTRKITSDTLEHTIGLQLEATMVVKIPTEKLEQFLDLIESKALVIEYKASKVEDVTEKMLDLNTRKETKLRIEKKYINLIENKTGKLEEVLAVEAKIDQIREEIEAMEGKLKYLNQRVAFSTIHLSLYQEPIHQTAVAAIERVTDYEDGFGVKVKNAFLSGWNLFKELIIALFYLWPLIAITTIILGYLRFKKQFKAKSESYS